MKELRRGGSVKLGLWISVVALVVTACGGAGVGDPCTTVGDREECGDEAVCEMLDNQATCLAICEDDDECAPNEACSGTSGSSVKACRPEAEL
jgi:hypothetical protein